MPWNHFRPTPEQIEETCREIRKDWDEATHRRRWVLPIKKFWTPPAVILEVDLDDRWDRDAWVTSSYLPDASG